jgi:membrane-associated protease RseP (regulator of RpoE activity)
MKSDQMQALLFFIAVGVVVAGLVSQPSSKSPATNRAMLHEITGEDAWNQPGGMPNQPGMAAPMRTYNPNGMAQNQGMQPVAMVQQKTPIAEGQAPPVLIKQMGMEVIEVSGGKVKVTGVMGKSWADKAGLKPGDVLLRFDNKPITSLEEFKTMTLKAPPEKDYLVKYLRDGNSKKTMVTIGEGEMEGFLPIKPAPAVVQGQPAAPTVVQGQPAAMAVALGQGPGAVYRCPQCGNMLSYRADPGGVPQYCKVCNHQMQRIR